MPEEKKLPGVFERPEAQHSATYIPEDFWWMNDVDRSKAINARARAYGGEGHLPRSRARDE